MLDRLRSMYNRLTAGGSTEAQAVQSGVWVTAINVGDRLLQLLKVIILARLLSPEAFGLLGIALVTIAALRRFSNLGFDEALIQREEENVDAYLNTAWVIKIIRGAVIAIIAFLAAPSLATFFGEPQAEPLIQLLGFTPLILGVQNPAVMYFRKHLNFHREFVYQVGGRLMDLLVAVTIALEFRSVWALPAGIVAMNLVKAVLSYGIHDYRPSIEFDLNLGREMFGFGKWMFVSSILVFIYGQGDDAFVGWFFTATGLGYYQLAYRFSNAPATEITHVISRVAFPTFSKVQDDTEKLRAGFFSTVQLSTVIAFPMAAGIAAVSRPFVHIFLGAQWSPMVPLLQILCVWGGLRALGANIGPVFKSLGRPDIETWTQAIQVLVTALIIIPVSERFGIVGVALSVIAGSITILIPQLYLVLSMVKGDARRLTLITIYPLFASTLMFLVVLLVNDTLLVSYSIFNLVGLVVVGVVSYCIVIGTVEMWTNYSVAPLLRRVAASI